MSKALRVGSGGFSDYTKPARLKPNNVKPEEPALRQSISDCVPGWRDMTSQEQNIIRAAWSGRYMNATEVAMLLDRVRPDDEVDQ